MIKKTKLEIIEETKNYYCEDVNRRAYKAGACSYLDEAGRMCAFGRCMIKPERYYGTLNETDPNYKWGCSISSALWINPDIYLKEEYRGHSIEFWQNLQSFHDNKDYWYENGLTKNGNKVYINLIEKYNEIV
jgi:hypothetical protein